MSRGRGERPCFEMMRALADRTRMEILQQLLKGPRRVQELNASLGVEQSLFSHHLRILREAGLVSSERSGRHVLYRLAPGVDSSTRNALDLGCCVLEFEEGRDASVA